MSEHIDLVRGWFRKGDSDLKSAKLIVSGEGPFDTVCFHAQQAAEKYLKGFLTYAGQPFPFTHNLEELRLCCAFVNPAPDLADVNLTILTPYAVQMRYDADFWPDQATAQEAIDLAEHVRSAILAVLPPEICL
ncbi:MAG: HEPN domain-containing protein [Candidatus Viridilinea halotolerans]|uniref:HEPN domain-containing protein n=1 Tax=Candidatus Viridilinea halotolerans TaxID=2491704 RepID=A0A426TWI2_9CHLR|nr:MAG: HEPN domain-containing protein [Candidatus Viridilinea halotolerans]